jgi:hypothetical protein
VPGAFSDNEGAEMGLCYACSYLQKPTKKPPILPDNFQPSILVGELVDLWSIFFSMKR